VPDSVEPRQIYTLAAERGVQIRRLNHKQDSLEDIFLKAMESGDLRPVAAISGEAQTPSLAQTQPETEPETKAEEATHGGL
jgi:hypothetical protein